MSNVHVPPRNPHPRRRVRHKHATRTMAYMYRLLRRVLDRHDMCTMVTRDREAYASQRHWKHKRGHERLDY